MEEVCLDSPPEKVVHPQSLKQLITLVGFIKALLYLVNLCAPLPHPLLQHTKSDQPVLGKSGVGVFLACSCPGELEDQTSRGVLRVRVGIECLCFQLVGKSFLK